MLLICDLQLTNAFSDCVVWFELVAGCHSGAATPTRNSNSKGNNKSNNNNNNKLNKTIDTNATNAIKRRQCVKLSVRISKCIFHFPHIFMQDSCNADAQLQRPAAGWQNKEAAHTHIPTHTHTHTSLTVVRTKGKPRQTRSCGRLYRRGSVYNLRFMSAMLTLRGMWGGREEVEEGAGIGVGKQLLHVQCIV